MVIDFRRILTVGAMSLLIGGLMACGGAVPPEPLPSSKKAEPASAQSRLPVKDTASERAVYDSLRAPQEPAGPRILEYSKPQGPQGPRGPQGAQGPQGA